jgi:hypothetical protein
MHEGKYHAVRLLIANAVSVARPATSNISPPTQQPFHPLLTLLSSVMGRFLDLALLLFGFQAAAVFAQASPVSSPHPCNNTMGSHLSN